MTFVNLMRRLRAKEVRAARGLFELPILTRSQIEDWIGREPDSIKCHEGVAILTYGVDEGDAVVGGKISHDNTIENGHALLIPPRATAS